MTTVQSCFINLVRNVVVGKKLPNDFEICDLVELYKFSKKQDMAHIVAYGLKKNNLIDLNSDLWKRYYNKQYSLAQFRVMNLENECKKVCYVFETAVVDYVPLKGAVIRSLYPESWMRVSCDIDILVRKEQLLSAENVLTEKLGYRKTRDGVILEHHHDNFTSPNGFTLELHLSLSEKETLAKDYLDEVWNNVTLVANYRHQFVMNDEMLYFYHIYHAAHHFKTGGCGVKAVLDTWLILNGIKEVNPVCLEMLKKSQLLEFSNAIETVAKKWFSGVPSDKYIYMEEYILNGGMQGGGNFVAAYQTTTNGNRVKYYIRRAFPSYDLMHKIYPQLKDKKYLLPYYWIKRLCMAFSSSKSKRTKAEIKTAWLEKEKSQKIKAMFDELGL